MGAISMISPSLARPGMIGVSIPEFAMADPLPPGVLAALQGGKKLEAVKQLRGITGLGLKRGVIACALYFQGWGG